MICELHFPKESFIEKEGRKTLKKGSLPSLPIHQIEFVAVNEIDHFNELQNVALLENEAEGQYGLVYSEEDLSHR